MYLIIDQGNSTTKVALYKGDSLFALERFKNAPEDQLIEGIVQLLESMPPDSLRSGIFSSVSIPSENFVNRLQSFSNILRMSNRCRIPLTNKYKTPQTLGYDRIAAAVAGFNLFKGKPVLCIDAGSCITYDFVDSSGAYWGGGISPGVHMRLKAMHTFTGKLPLVSAEADPPLIGNTTESSLQSGAINGIQAEMEGIISRYEMSHPDLNIILTGGDANYFDKKLKKSIFAVPNLVLMGLKDILEYNAER